MADHSPTGWRRHLRRPIVVGTVVALAVLAAGGAAAFATSGSGGTGYRLAKVVRATIGTNLDLVGTVQPVHTASAAFQVSGQVATVSATVGQHVSAGQVLGTLDTTALSESVSSAQSSLSSAESKLTQDEDSQATSTTTTPTTTPASGSAGQSGGASAGTSQVSKDQAALVADQATASAAQQQETADLTQAESTCGTSNSSSPSGPTTTTPSTTTTTTAPTNDTACSAALGQVSTDQQTVSDDQRSVATDESALARALTKEAAASSSAGSSGKSATPSAAGDAKAATSGGTSASDGASQIDTDEASIDVAEANLVRAEQSLHDAQLTSPITGTVASVGMTVGDTVGADSSTEAIMIIGLQSFEATSTLSSAQVTSVKVGQSAQVTVDGASAPMGGTVSQVGPVQVSDGSYSYPVVVALPSSDTGLFSGSSAGIAILTSQAQSVLAVPTSAVETDGTRSDVLVISTGNLTAKAIKVGVVGDIYTQVLSGLTLGQSVVLADYSEAVPASSATSVGGLGGFGGFAGGGRFNFIRVAPGAGGSPGLTQVTFGG